VKFSRDRFLSDPYHPLNFMHIDLTMASLKKI